MKRFLCFLFLCSCGFTPMFAHNDTDVYIPVISGINGIELRNALNTNFGGQKPETAPYSLVVNLRSPQTKYKAIEPSGYATWQEIAITANYTINYNGEKIASGTEKASESYTFVRYLVASNAAYNNAVENAINVLAEKISARAIAEISKHQQGTVQQ